MAKVGNLVVNMVGDTKGFKKSLDDAAKHMRIFSTKMKNIGRQMSGIGKRMSLFVTAPIVGIGIAAIKTASDMEEIESKFDAVFKEIAGSTKQWADEFSTAMGRSRKDVYDWMAALQDTFVPLGYTRQKGAELSKMLAQLTVDVASFQNKSEPEVLRDFQSAIVGNHETVRKYGIIITQATLNQALLNMGVEGGIKAATEQEKVMARVNVIMEGTKDAQGDAARTAGSFANQMRALKASFQEVLIVIGEQIIPVLLKFMEKIRSVLEWFRNLDESQIKLIVKLGLVAAAIGPIIMMLGFFITALGAVLSPIGLVVLAIGALAIAGVLVYKHWEKVKGFFIDLWTDLAEFAKKIFNHMKKVILTPVREVLEFLLKVAGSFKKVFKNIDLEGLENAVAKVSGKIEEADNTIQELGKSFQRTGEHLGNAGEKIKGLFGKIKELIGKFKELTLGQGVVVETTKVLTEAIIEQDKALYGVMHKWTRMPATIKKTSAPMMGYIDRLNAMAEHQRQLVLAEEEAMQKSQDMLPMWSNIWTMMGDKSMSAAEKMKEAIKTIFVSLLQAIGKEMLVQAMRALIPLPGVFAPWAAAPAFAASAAAFVASGFVQSLAQGGIIGKPTYLVGEGEDSEAVLPLNKQTFDALGASIARAMASNPAVVNVPASQYSIRSQLVVDGDVLAETVNNQIEAGKINRPIRVQ